MSVKELDDGSLVLKESGINGAVEAFENDRIIEAFNLLHAYIEFLMINMYEKHWMMKGGSLLELQEMGIMQNYRFDCLKTELKALKIVPRKDIKKLEKWYGLRNKIIHRLLSYGYLTYEWNKITRKEANSGFKTGLYLVDTFDKISMSLHNF